MKINSILFITFLLLSSISCKKNTTDKSEYMVCKVNGVQTDFWRDIKGFSPGSGSNRGAIFENNNKEFQINVSTKDANKSFGIVIYDSANFVRSGTYKITTLLSGNAAADYKDYETDNLYAYTTDTINTGTLILQIDEKKQHVNGTFSADLKFELYNEVVHITEGKFSLPYRTR